MPRKTRKQKVLADLHRKSQEATIQNPQLVKRQNYITSKIPASVDTPIYEYNKNIVTKPKISTLPSNYAYIREDLLRITIFTFLAISFQVVLYFLV